MRARKNSSMNRLCTEPFLDSHLEAAWHALKQIIQSGRCEIVFVCVDKKGHYACARNSSPHAQGNSSTHTAKGIAATQRIRILIEDARSFWPDLTLHWITQTCPPEGWKTLDPFRFTSAPAPCAGRSRPRPQPRKHLPYHLRTELGQHHR